MSASSLKFDRCRQTVMILFTLAVIINYWASSRRSGHTKCFKKCHCIQDCGVSITITDPGKAKVYSFPKYNKAAADDFENLLTKT